MRSSCEASATNSRCAWTMPCASLRAASSSRSISSSVVASSATSSSASGFGIVRAGSRVVAISRAVVRERRDRAHRAARDGEAGERREDRAARDADGEEEPEAADRRVELVVVARHLDVGGPRADEGRRRPAPWRPRGRRSGTMLGVGGGRRTSTFWIGWPDGRRDANDLVADREVLERVPRPCPSRDRSGRERDAVGGRLELVAEVVLQALLRELADDGREREEDDEGEAGRDAGEPPAHRPARRALRKRGRAPLGLGRLAIYSGARTT